VAALTAADYLRAVESGFDGLAEFYGEQLDAPCEAARAWAERGDAVLLSALYYVRQGLKVVALTPGRKIPLGDRDGCCGGTHARGSLDATGDPGVVADWWRTHPTANVGIATGHRVDVIDQDGPEGAVSWARLGRLDAWPAVLGITCTPRAGGVHRYVNATGNGNGAKIAPGIDYRGAGGYVVAPPSIVDGKRYTWAQPLDLSRAVR
jgi:hypothetical protein